MIDIYASILPGISLGGIKLGDNIANFYGNLRLTSKNHGMCFYETNMGVSLSAECASGLILTISAGVGYKGLLYDKYKVGMLLDPLLDSGKWKFDDVFWDGVMLPISGDKVFVASLEDPDITELRGSKIEEITIFIE